MDTSEKQNMMNQDLATDVEHTLVCIVAKVIFHDKENGYSILSVLSHIKKGPFCICGILNGKPKDTVLICKGIWKEHPEYGMTFYVNSWEGTESKDNRQDETIIVKKVKKSPQKTETTSMMEKYLTQNKENSHSVMLGTDVKESLQDDTIIEKIEKSPQKTEIACLVEKVLFQNKEDSYSVLLVRTPEEIAPFRICGQLGSFKKKTLLLCKGEWKEHKVYGPEFKVDSWRRLDDYYEFKKDRSNDEKISALTYSNILNTAFIASDNWFYYLEEDIMDISKNDKGIRRTLYQIAKHSVDENIKPRSTDTMMKLYILVNYEVTNRFWDKVYETRRLWDSF